MPPVTQRSAAHATASASAPGLPASPVISCASSEAPAKSDQTNAREPERSTMRPTTAQPALAPPDPSALPAPHETPFTVVIGLVAGSGPGVIASAVHMPSFSL